jgi:hypothetical protein
MRLGIRVRVVGPISVYGSIGTPRRRRRKPAPRRTGSGAPRASYGAIPMTRPRKASRKAVFWVTAAIVAATAGAALRQAAADTGSAPAVTTVSQNTVADCTAAFEAQIQHLEPHQLGHADLPTPAQCSGLSSSQVKQAENWSLEAAAP